jgi:hypothetical protein
MSIEVTILTGAKAGKRLRREREPITFGRGGENDVVIDLPHVSRSHGELRMEEGRWVLVNRSANGTRLGGRLVTDEPAVINGGGEIVIGEDAVLEVVASQPAAVAAAPVGQATSKAKRPTKGMSGRAQLWIGIGVFWVVCLGIIVFVSTLKRSEGGAASGGVAELTAEQVHAEIYAPLEARPADARQANEYLREATENFAMLETRPDMLYRSYEAYRQALAYSPGEMFDSPLDQRRFQVVKQRLAEGIYEQYRAAYTLLRSQRYDAAVEAFRRLSQQYPAGSESVVFSTIQKHWAEAERRLAASR